MRKIVFILFVFVSIFAIYGCTKNNNSDAFKFKKEYEALNDQAIENTTNKYLAVEIADDNIVTYASVDDIIDLLDNKSGIIYFGYSECPWCRNAVPVLLEAAQELGMDKILYMNIKDERNEIKVKTDGTLEIVKEGSQDYQRLIERLESVLDDYTLEDMDGNEINTNQKRIYVPMVIFVYKGEIVGIHEGTVTSQTNPYKALTEEQKNELMDIYISYMHKVLNDVCDSSC